VTVNDNEGDLRSKPQWSAGEQMDAVLRLLRGESLDALSRELGVEAHPSGGVARRVPGRRPEGLKGQRTLDDEDRRMREAERKIGELTMEVEVWRRAAEKGGAAMPPAKRPR
jgi:hypothetical protein